MTGKQASDEQKQTHVYPNGDKYIGELHAGKKHGFGELIKSDGKRYSDVTYSLQ